MKLLSCVQLFAAPWTVAYQAPPPMEFSRQGYWSGLPFPSPGDLPNPGIEPGSPSLQADALPSEPPGKLKNWNLSPIAKSNLWSSFYSRDSFGWDMIWWKRQRVKRMWESKRILYQVSFSSSSFLASPPSESCSSLKLTRLALIHPKFLSCFRCLRVFLDLDKFNSFYYGP